MEIPERQTWELNQRLSALRDELGFWQQETTRNKDFRRHNSQVRSFAELLNNIRGKVVQRREGRFATFLQLADEYAWLCYQPIYEAGLKEPPLVFLNGGYSPY